MDDRIRRLAALLRQVSAVAGAAGTGIGAALDQVAAIQKHYASGGLLGIVGNLDRVRTALEATRHRPADLAGAADSLAGRVVSLAGETTPDEVIAVLTPVADDLARIAAGVPELDRALADIQALTTEVLAGGSPGPLVGKVQAVRDTLAPVQTSLWAAHATATEEIELTRRAGSTGGSGEVPRQDTPGPAADAPLSGAQQANLARYRKKLPVAAGDTVIDRLPDGSVRFETRVPGRVPGSYALYIKIVGHDGTTLRYWKITVRPDGSIAHVKDKMR